jgi:hypothetical protein
LAEDAGVGPDTSSTSSAAQTLAPALTLTIADGVSRKSGNDNLGLLALSSPVNLANSVVVIASSWCTSCAKFFGIYDRPSFCSQVFFDDWWSSLLVPFLC